MSAQEAVNKSAEAAEGEEGRSEEAERPPSPRHSPPPLSAQPAKSILKKRPRPTETLVITPESKTGLVWDEENLEETSRERGTRQKIDEVETPYLWPGDYSIDPSDSDDEVGEPDGETADNTRKNVASSLDELAEKLQSVKKHQEFGHELKTHPEVRAEEERDFKKRRKLHYNEGHVLKTMRKQQAAIKK